MITIREMCIDITERASVTCVKMSGTDHNGWRTGRLRGRKSIDPVAATDDQCAFLTYDLSSRLWDQTH